MMSHTCTKRVRVNNKLFYYSLYIVAATCYAWTEELKNYTCAHMKGKNNMSYKAVKICSNILGYSKLL